MKSILRRLLFSEKFRKHGQGRAEAVDFARPCVELVGDGIEVEPPRECRRLVVVSHAVMADSVS